MYLDCGYTVCGLGGLCSVCTPPGGCDMDMVYTTVLVTFGGGGHASVLATFAAGGVPRPMLFCMMWLVRL